MTILRLDNLYSIRSHLDKSQREFAEMITNLKDQNRRELEESLKQFHGKMESRFSEELKNLKEVYGLLMQRLPNVNLTLTKKV